MDNLKRQLFCFPYNFQLLPWRTDRRRGFGWTMVFCSCRFWRWTLAMKNLLNHCMNSKLSWNLPFTSLSTCTALSTLSLVNAAWSSLKFWMYSCSNFVSNLIRLMATEPEDRRSHDETFIVVVINFLQTMSPQSIMIVNWLVTIFPTEI